MNVEIRHQAANATLPDDHVDRLRLIRSPRVGATTFRRLMDEFGSATAALAELPKIAAAAGVRDYSACPPDAAMSELRAGMAVGARPLFLGMPDYPRMLADIADAPPVLWSRGDASLAQKQAIAMVGARNASALGRRMAAHLSGELGKLGYIVVSGLARGIDAAAHEATLTTGTIAILAGGVDVIYPQENADLAARIVETGLILSEMPPGLQPQARHFPRRNRIISGIAEGLVVVEGAAKSGSLITARNALDQGREVMAVPGHPFDARAAGCNMLIRDGATLVRSAGDIAAALTRTDRETPTPREAAPTLPLDPPKQRQLPLSGLDAQIANLLGPSPISEDSLIRQLRAPSAHVLSALAEMDLRGVIERHPGGLVSACAG